MRLQNTKFKAATVKIICAKLCYKIKVFSWSLELAFAHNCEKQIFAVISTWTSAWLNSLFGGNCSTKGEDWRSGQFKFLFFEHWNGILRLFIEMKKLVKRRITTTIAESKVTFQTQLSSNTAHDWGHIHEFLALIYKKAYLFYRQDNFWDIPRITMATSSVRIRLTKL